MVGTAEQRAEGVVEGVEVPGPRRPPALSPSRADDFRRCPLLYRFRAIDRLPEPPSPAALRGTVVHAVLERLFALPAGERTPGNARELVDPVLVALPPDERAVLGDAGAVRELVERYFAVEDPRRLEPEACELRVEAVLPSGTPLRGYVDRLDAAPGGALRVVDYKTGRAPDRRRELRALAGVRFYALTLLHGRGVLPRALRLVHLGDATTLTHVPDAATLDRFARTLDALWAAVLRAAPTGDYPPNPGPGCAWCAHQARCPAFGGTPPEYPGWPDAGPAVIEGGPHA